MSTLANGQTVGRYRIERFLGAGAMGEVYVAEDPHIERRLAIKTVRVVGPPHEIEDRKRRLLREARAAGRLLHPNVVTLFDAGEVDNLLYLAFELVEGSDLAARAVAPPPLTLAEVLAIVRQAAVALEFAHRQGIVHRDIKPSNILLDLLGRVKVADFGIAKVSGQSTELTMAGSVMGSPQYLSPEQIRGEELDGRSDIFSLGVVLYELLSNKRPFEGETITTLVYQILHKEPPPVSELRGGIPPRLERLLDGMLAKDRDQRLANAGLVAEELAAVERELPDETLAAPAAQDTQRQVPTRVLPRRTTAAAQIVPPPPIPPPPPGFSPASPLVAPLPAGRSRSAPWIAVGIAVVVLALLAGGWFAFTRLRGVAPVEVPQTTEPTPAAPGDIAEIGPGSTVPGTGTISQQAAPPPSAPGARPTGPAEALPPTRPTPAPTLPTAPRPGSQEPAATDPRLADRRPDSRPSLPDTRPVPPSAAPSTSLGPKVPVPAPEPVEDEPSPARTIRADQRLQSGLELAFRVTPPDAFVLIDGTNVGRASEWSGLKGVRSYTLPGPGEYEIKIRKDGMREQILAVDAGDTGGTKVVTVRLQSKAAAEIESSDLEVVRVREAVAFKVRPPEAEVLVDGQSRGQARKLSGGLGGDWLKLSAGRHRVSLTAPGYRRHDLLVEVGGGAEEERERITVNLVKEDG